MANVCIKLTEGNVLQLIDSFDTILIDCDGVLWNGSDVIEGALDSYKKLMKLGKKIFPVTNNSTRTRQEYEEKCKALGFPVTVGDIVGSGFVTAQYLKKKLQYKGKIFLIGSPSFHTELTSVGYDVIWEDTFQKVKQDVVNLGTKALTDMDLDPDVGCVVVGLDSSFNYAKLTKAVSYLGKKGVLFVASNTDSSLPMGKGRILPGTGSLVAAVATAIGRPPDVICGKPYQPIFDVVKELYGVDAKRTVMIGDRLDTDIQLAHNCGMRAILVLTGFSDLEEVKAKQASSIPELQKQIPHYYCNSFGELGELAERAKGKN